MVADRSRLMLAMVGLAVLALLAVALLQDRGTRPFAVNANEVARVEMARGRDQVVLARRADTGDWAVLSAADAPGDEPRIARMIAAMAALNGRPAETLSTAEPLEVRLSDAKGNVLAHAAVRPGEVQPLPGGPRLAVAELPALPLWPSAWSSLRPPRIDAADIVAAWSIGPDGRMPLAAEEAADLKALLAGLSAQGFVSAATINWGGARAAQVQLAGGALVDVQQVPSGKGSYLVRLTSDRKPDIRVARAYAFRTTRPLP